MFIDTDVAFSDDQALTATAASTNTIYLGNTSDVPLRLIIGVSTVRTNVGASTLDITVQTETDADFGSPTTVLTLPQLAAASFDSTGILYDVELPRSIAEKYVRLYYTVGTEDFTVLKIYAYLTPASQTNVG